MLFLLPEASVGQSGNEVQMFSRLMEDGKEYVERSQYIYAAKIFNFIARRCPDSTLQAEALYRFKETGDRAADEMSEIFDTQQFL